jgi:hypothetical protein
VPHLDDFDGVACIIDRVDDAMLALPNAEEGDWSGELFAA